MKNVILFSGGRTSGYMLRRLIDEEIKSWDDWMVIFCNTGKERNETLDFVHEVETRWNVPVVWLEYHRVLASSIPAGIFPTDKRNQNLAKAAEAGETTHWFNRVDYATASRNGEPFDELLRIVSALPNVTGRSCSAQLKIRTAFRFMFFEGYKEFQNIIGIRKDEEHRAIEIKASSPKFAYPRFPLVEWGLSVVDVNQFWKRNDFDLLLDSYEGNCDLCFLKAKWKRLRIITEHPELLYWWKAWEANHPCNAVSGRGNMFRDGEPYALLEQIVQNQKLQSEFCFVSGKDQDIPCSCAERAFGGED